MENKKNKILFICNESVSVKNFRQELIKKLISEGMNIAIVAFDDKYKAEIENLGVKFYSVKGSNRSLNPVSTFSLKNKFKKVIKDYRPDLVITFQLKPNIFGTRAALSCGIKNIFSFVEGAGDVFIKTGFKWRVIRKIVCRMIKKSFYKVNEIFFINETDRKMFIKLKLIRREQGRVIHGVGVDVEKFAFKPIKNYDTFVMVSRLMDTKGVYEYLDAAREVKKDFPNAKFNLLGGEVSIKVSDIQEYIDDGTVTYYGQVPDTRPYVEEATVSVLPSYREGLGLVNVEANAIGRAIITTDTVGAKDTCIDGYNGLLVPIKDSSAIAEKMRYCLTHKEEVKIMGENGRKLAENIFDQKIINNKICGIVKAYL